MIWVIVLLIIGAVLSLGFGSPVPGALCAVMAACVVLWKIVGRWGDDK